LFAWAIPLLFVSYFGTLACAAALSPTTYDWRSNLISPRNNPEFHWLPSFGITIAGLLIIPITGCIYRRLRVASPVITTIGAAAFYHWRRFAHSYRFDSAAAFALERRV
jgi:hypothetical protein